VLGVGKGDGAVTETANGEAAKAETPKEVAAPAAAGDEDASAEGGAGGENSASEEGS
jgi:hypothetical protein